MDDDSKWSARKQSNSGSAWVRLLQTLGKGRGERQDDRAAAQRTSRISAIVAEKEFLKEEIKRTFVPPKPEQVREAVEFEIANRCLH